MINFNCNLKIEINQGSQIRERCQLLLFPCFVSIYFKKNKLKANMPSKPIKKYPPKTLLYTLIAKANSGIKKATFLTLLPAKNFKSLFTISLKSRFFSNKNKSLSWRKKLQKNTLYAKSKNHNSKNSKKSISFQKIKNLLIQTFLQIRTQSEKFLMRWKSNGRGFQR